MEREEFLDIKTISLVESDCATIVALLTNVRSPILNLMVLPYVALFCKESTKYFEVDLGNNSIVKQVSDIRNAIKIYSERFAKSKKRFLDTDNAQDEEYKSLLRFKFMQSWNIHYNLGVYFNEQGSIIGNTQLIADALSLNGLKGDARKKRCFALGEAMGNIVGKMHASFLKAGLASNISINTTIPPIYYMDVNTNRKNSHFVNKYGKGVNIFILHMLSCVGFVNNFLAAILPDDNLWLFRIRYIVAYYVLLGIEKLSDYLERKYGVKDVFVQQSRQFVDERFSLFQSSFRNCMMHYDLWQNGTEVIKSECCDLQKPFYGLVESCFDGCSFLQYKEKIILFMEQLEQLLMKQINIDVHNLKPL